MALTANERRQTLKNLRVEMGMIETDYLVVGAGASGMAFTDTLIEQSDAEVMMVERRHRPGGHWNDAYPFVRLHLPAEFYGVGSRPLEAAHMHSDADRAGLATGTEVCEYFLRVLEDHFLPSGQVRFSGMTDYLGRSGDVHEVRSLVTGETTTVRVRRKLVDARYPELSIPSRHTPSFGIDADAHVVTPNELVEMDGSASGYTVLGAGKTSMDTVGWLLEQGVRADRIRWIRPRDAWAMDRQLWLSSDEGSPFLDFTAILINAAAEAGDGADLAHRLAAEGAFRRIDESIEPGAFFGAILSEAEIDRLRAVENVVRMGRVDHVGTTQISLTEGTVPSDPAQVHVDCTACGTAPIARGPIFQPGVIDTNLTTFGIVPWSSAVTAYVEATRDDDAEKNRLCPVVRMAGSVEQVPELFGAAFAAQMVRMGEADLAAWDDCLRLNPGNGLNARLDEPDIQAAMTTIMMGMPRAVENLQRLVGDVDQPTALNARSMAPSA